MVRAMVLSAALAAGLAACSSSSSPAQPHVVQACGLTSSAGNGDWVAPPLTPSESRWTFGDPLVELEDAAKEWADQAVSATRAAREDSRYSNLRDATVDISAMRNDVVAWAQTDRAKHARFDELSSTDPFLQQGLEIESRVLAVYNGVLQTWRVECNAAADELND
jgi:hypothetical protein